MRLLLLLTISLVEIATALGKWLFILSAPVLLIVTATYYQAGRSYLEPLFGLVLVSGMFVVTRWLSLNVEDWLQVHGPRNVPQDYGVTIGLTSGETERWNRRPEDGGQKRAGEKEATCRNNRRRVEQWRQANPWGGFNPHE